MDSQSPSLMTQEGGEQAEHERAHLLIVDDDQFNRESLARRLRRHEFIVSVAADGLSALRHIAQKPCDLVLLDVMMPNMSGLEVLQRVRESHSATRLPIIMATARDESADIVQALELGANDYVTKPFDFPVVLARARTQLQMKRSVEQVIDLQRQLSERNSELEAANGQLRDAARRTGRDLQTAAKVQQTLLPPRALSIAGAQFAWAFRPCEALAGDSLNLFPLGSDHVGMYVLDVSGHGVAASLLAVAATRLISVVSGSEPLARDSGTRAIVCPSEVAERLSQGFPWNSQTEQFLTLFYAVLDTRERVLTYTSAGHPGAIYVSGGNEARVLDDGSGLPIGVGEGYEQGSIRLAPGDRIYLYSDGITEAMNPRQEFFGQQTLMTLLQEGRKLELVASIHSVMQEIDRWHAGIAPGDDMTLLGVQCD